MDFDWNRFYKILKKFIITITMPQLIDDNGDYKDDDVDDEDYNEVDNNDSNNVNYILKDIETKLQVYLENN